MYIIYARNVLICRKIEYPELRNFNGKLCTVYAHIVWIRKKIEYHVLHVFNSKLCTLYMYGMSGLAEKLNVHNCITWMGNCIRNMHEMYGFAGNLNI